jgi:hypothetical protein
MACNKSLYSILSSYQTGNINSGGTWEFGGFSTTEFGTYGNGYLNAGDVVADIVDFEPLAEGYYKYNYLYTGPGGCVDSSTLTIRVIKLCSNTDGDGYPITELAVCLPSNVITTFNMYVLAKGMGCPSIISGGYWYQSPGDFHQAGAAFNPFTGDLNIDTLESISPFSDGEVRTYNFLYNIESVSQYVILANGTEDCTSCLAKVSITISNASEVTYVVSDYGSSINPIIVGQSGTLGDNDFIAFADIFTNSYVNVYYGEGPDVGGCGTTPAINTTISAANTIQVNNGSGLLDLPISCNDPLTINNGQPFNFSSLQISALPQAQHAFYMCVADNAASCNSCKTVYITQNQEVRNSVDYYTEFVWPIPGEPTYLTDNVSILSFKTNGVERLGSPITDFGVQNIITVEGEDYVTNLVDTLNSVPVPLTFSVATGQNCNGKNRYFNICWPSFITFEITISPADLLYFGINAPYTQIRYKDTGVDVFSPGTGLWEAATDENLIQYGCANQLSLEKNRISGLLSCAPVI